MMSPDKMGAMLNVEENIIGLFLYHRLVVFHFSECLAFLELSYKIQYLEQNSSTNMHALMEKYYQPACPSASKPPVETRC